MLIAERVVTFGMKVIGVDRDYFPMVSFVDKFFVPEKILDALPMADVVIMAAPHTHDSEKMMSAKQFEVMKSSAYFINVSRGKTVCTNSLTKALQEGGIHAAGLDVTDPEPLPEDHLLRKMPNVVITPHISGLSKHNRQRSYELIKQNIDHFINGIPLINVVNKHLGY